MKIENKPFTFFDYLDSLKRRRDEWKKEQDFQDRQNGDVAASLYMVAYLQGQHLDREISTIIKQLEV